MSGLIADMFADGSSLLEMVSLHDWSSQRLCRRE
jgi:hypothetical protein